MRLTSEARQDLYGEPYSLPATRYSLPATRYPFVQWPHPGRRPPIPPRPRPPGKPPRRSCWRCERAFCNSFCSAIHCWFDSTSRSSYVGVAKRVTIVPIRVWSCGTDTQQGPYSTTERMNWGLDWIRSADNPNRFHRPALVSMSMYVRPNDALLAAHECVINRIVSDGTTFDGFNWSGITVIASANNHARGDIDHPNDTSPARLSYRNDPSVAFPGVPSVARVISVGGSGRATVGGVLTDVRWQCPMFAGEPCYTESYVNRGDVPIYGSNHGNSVDIYAPAHDVESAFGSATDAYRSPRPPFYVPYELRSGTSYAAPFVAGLAARILQAKPWLTPRQVWDEIRNNAQTVPTPFDTDGCRAGHYTAEMTPICDAFTSNSLLANWRYNSSSCTIQYP